MTAPSGVTRIDVVLPAHDEEDRIAACLDALLAARARLAEEHPDVAVSVTVVLDGCTDDTATVVERFPVDVVATAHVGVGRARTIGATHALRRHPADPASRWLAHSDADSRVPEGWLVQQADALRSGAHVLVGAVVPDPDDLDPVVLARWTQAHPPGAALGHVHGANLGVLASAYLALGGFDPVPEHEDVRLVERAHAMGFRVDATVDLPVVTSGRFAGRTPGGYAEHLRREYGDAS
ncbi:MULTISPECIES: glycosyltransferase [unclassified Curtobacterium]|uniref:glycosyltransferase n=1 Tax=unclassified Curtobacterium TaxID=257496 RepID=UPI000FA47A6D|nr:MULTISPECIES: glycosyltransferase [unclassified Curtobacterium]ROQ07005.1 glycosyl transferase family 2 [Curtobacterium sp. PhB171]ROQ27931.1 glycosyl transferase family 2 [Curtobacterium sp. PhB170]ROS34861.1 glycosyl transferase family 2 [Curtobacterium sp. PhB131]ROS72772.1 glycosyl transferase family 2 [Curtobacterium sp. PhB141]